MEIVPKKVITFGGENSFEVLAVRLNTSDDTDCQKGLVVGVGLQTISYDRKLSLFDCDNSLPATSLTQPFPVNKFC